MASNSLILFAAFVVVVGLAAPAVQAQRVLGLSGVIVNGTVHCSVNAATASTAAPFPNAAVQLQCGGNVVAATTTNADGAFSISLRIVTSLVSTIIGRCKLVVTTPLSTCDASLPATGILQSDLLGGGLLGGIVGGVVGLIGDIINLLPIGFNLVQ